MAAGGGGAWKVAYADFVTAMMAFFLVMWITAQSQQVRQAVAEHFLSPEGEVKNGRHRPQSPQLMRKSSPHEPRWQASKSKKHDPTDAYAEVLFEEESDQLDEKARDDLKRLTPLLTGKLQRIEIRGHSSRRPLSKESPFRSAWDLCYARCQAARSFLEEHGIASERIRISLAAGYEPRYEQADALWQARNARVEISMLPEFVKGTPGAAEKTPAASSPTEASTSSHGH